jgi:hypothetical protein
MYGLADILRPGHPLYSMGTVAFGDPETRAATRVGTESLHGSVDCPPLPDINKG